MWAIAGDRTVCLLGSPVSSISRGLCLRQIVHFDVLVVAGYGKLGELRLCSCGLYWSSGCVWGRSVIAGRYEEVWVYVDFLPKILVQTFAGGSRYWIQLIWWSEHWFTDNNYLLVVSCWALLLVCDCLCACHTVGCVGRCRSAQIVRAWVLKYLAEWLYVCAQVYSQLLIWIWWIEGRQGAFATRLDERQYLIPYRPRLFKLRLFKP